MVVTSPYSEDQSAGRQGFTLIELLMVIAVVAILTGVTFGISSGVRNFQNRAQARAELAIIAQGLDRFKSSHDDYPWAGSDPANPEENGKILFQALTGWLEFRNEGGAMGLRPKLPASVPPGGPSPFVDISKLSYVDISQPEGAREMNPEIDDLSTSMPANYVFVDPWGDPVQPYVYFYGKGPTGFNTWEIFGYHLYSTGPDQEQDVSSLNRTTGILESDFRTSGKNIDNIYVGE